MALLVDVLHQLARDDPRWRSDVIFKMHEFRTLRLHDGAPPGGELLAYVHIL